MDMHPGDGSDANGRHLTVTIRIGPDGAVYFHDLPPDLLPVVLTLRPDDPDLNRRRDAAAAFAQEFPT
jgi:hypothetical protein